MKTKTKMVRASALRVGDIVREGERDESRQTVRTIRRKGAEVIINLGDANNGFVFLSDDMVRVEAP